MPRLHCDKDRSERKHIKKSSSRIASDRVNERSSRHKSHKSRDFKLPKGAKKISEDDYFLRQTEFQVWLAQTKNNYVEDLSTDEAMKLFMEKFARKWNHGKLSKFFYEGLPDTVVEQTKRTRYQWGFLTSLRDKERFELAAAKDSVDVATKQAHLLILGGKKEIQKEVQTKEDRSIKKRQHHVDEGTDREEDRKRVKTTRYRNLENRDAMDELVEKNATGREAQIEKRRQFADKLHGAARDREAARDGLDLSEDFLMGGRTGNDEDIKRRIAHRDLVRRRKQEQEQSKLAGLLAKESARMEKFLSDMGLAGSNAPKDGKPMTVAPRR